MCSSVKTEGHTYVDSVERETYVSGEGETRQWQHCTGCGNVRNRRVVHFSNVRPSYFRKVYDAARADSAQIAEATSDYDTSPAARGTLYFHCSDGIGHAGFAVRPDGELVYVFSTVKGMGAAIVATALAKGATHLDCFDGHLTSLYGANGFQRVTSLANWTDGEPDVVFMAIPGHFLQALGKAEACAGPIGPVAVDPITLNGPERKAGHR